MTDFFCWSQRLKSIANNRIDANLMIKQYTVFRYLHQLSQNIGSNTFIRIYSSYFAQENLQGKAQRTHTPYADSDVLQNFCVNSHLGQGSGKEHAIKEEHILHAVLQAQIFV